MVLTSVVLAGLAGSAAAATVSVAHETKRVINGHEQLDRLQWFNVHSSPGGINWRDEDTQDFMAMNAHLGRSFVFSSVMGQAKEDASRPGYVDVQSLMDHCKKYPLNPGNWPEDSMDFVHSARPEQFFSNSCDGPDGKRPSGFVPGNADAIAEVFQVFREHCMMPTKLDRYLVEVANECEVKTGDGNCGVSLEDMLEIHQKVAARLHKVGDGKKTLVCGPTGAYPEFEAKGFDMFRKTFAPFVSEPALDCLSMHYYDTATNNQDMSQYSARTGSNLDALLDLQEAYSAAARGSVQPLLVSEYGSGFKNQPVDYSPAHDFFVLRGVNSKLMQFLDRPDRILKAIPFIVDKATWFNAGPGAKQSYPWVLWRNPSGDKTTWEQTHLHKFYEMWSEVRGTQVLASSSDLNLQVQAFLSDSTLFVALNSLRTSALDVDLSWAKSLAAKGGEVSRLFLDPSTKAPKLERQPFQGSVPKLSLQPEELAILKIELGQSVAPSSAVHETTLYSAKTLQPLSGSAASFQLKGSGLQGVSDARLRISFSCAAEKLDAVLGGMEVTVNGQKLVVSPEQQMKGFRHVSNQGDFLGGLEIPVEAKGLESGSVEVGIRSDTPADAIISSVVLVVQSAAQQLLV